MRHAAPDSQWRARAAAVSLALLAVIVVWILLVSNRADEASAQTAACTGDGTATLTLTDGDNDGVAETSTDTVIPASCDIGLRTDGRTARYWSIDVYDAGDASKRYFCHRGTDAPPGEPSCDTPQPTNPTPDSDVSGAIVKENGIWRLYLHLNTRVPNHSLSVRAHYGWKGTTACPSQRATSAQTQDPCTDQCPAEPGTGPCSTDQCPTEPGTGPCTNTTPPPGQYDLAVAVQAPAAIGPRDEFVPVTLTVANTPAADIVSEEAVVFPRIEGALGQGKLFMDPESFSGSTSTPGIGDCEEIETYWSKASNLRYTALGCEVEPLAPRAIAAVRINVKPEAERLISSANVFQGTSTGYQCFSVDEVTCDNNTASQVITRIPVPGTRITAPDLSETNELFLEGNSSRSEGQEVARTAASRGPKVKRVEIAVLRRASKLKVAAKLRCRWLADRAGHFKAIRPGPRARSCDRFVWLRAEGTARWRFRGVRPLPKGRYVVYARAIDAAGHTSSAFSLRRGDKRSFEVR